MATIKNVILDWSGTIVDDFKPVVEATNEIFKAYGRPAMSEAEFRESFRLPFTEWYEEVLPEATLAEIEHHYHTAFKLVETNVDLIPGAMGFLEFCQKNNLQLFLLSTIHHQHFVVQGERLGIKHFFRQAYTQAIDKRKTILELLAIHNLNADETIFVGDMVHDIDTGHHGGVISCAVLTGYDSVTKLKKANPDLLFRGVDDLQSFLDRHHFETGPREPVVPTVGALISDPDNRVLMVRTHKWSNKWGIPGGKIKPFESSLEALRRETLEETGLELEDIQFVIVQDCIKPPEFYRQAHFLLLNYTAKTQQTEVTLNEEAEEYQWCTTEEALALDLNGPTRKLIEHVRSHHR